MRRRLKTTKKEKKVAPRAKAKKATPKKKVQKIKKEAPQKKGMQIRVIGHSEEAREEKNKAIEKEIDREKELEKKLEEIKKARLEKIKPDKPSPKETLKTYEEVERNKQVIMWSGIVFFMVLITFFWVNNTKRVVRESRENLVSEGQLETEWDYLVDNLSDKINEMKSGLDTIKSFESGATSSPNNLSTLPGDESEIGNLSEEDFQKINQKIEPELKDKIRFIY